MEDAAEEMSVVERDMDPVRLSNQFRSFLFESDIERYDVLYFLVVYRSVAHRCTRGDEAVDERLVRLLICAFEEIAAGRRENGAEIAWPECAEMRTRRS